MYTHTSIHTYTYLYTLINRQFSSLQHEEAAKESWESIQQFNQADDLRLTPPCHLTLLPSPLNSYPPSFHAIPFMATTTTKHWLTLSGLGERLKQEAERKCTNCRETERWKCQHNVERRGEWRREESEEGRRVKEKHWKSRVKSGERRAKSQQGRRQVENFLFTCCAVFHAQWLQCD